MYLYIYIYIRMYYRRRRPASCPAIGRGDEMVGNWKFDYHQHYYRLLIIAVLYIVYSDSNSTNRKVGRDGWRLETLIYTYMCMYIYIYIYTHTYVCMYIYIYIYISLIELGFLDSSFSSSSSQFELFELILFLKLDNRFPVERFESAVSQSAVPSPPLGILDS